MTSSDASLTESISNQAIPPVSGSDETMLPSTFVVTVTRLLIPELPKGELIDTAKV